MKEKLVILRERKFKYATRKGIWFYADTAKSKYSVVNIGELMKTAPNAAQLPGLFVGWEAIKMDKKGGLTGGPILRADSWEELKKQL